VKAIWTIAVGVLAMVVTSACVRKEPSAEASKPPAAAAEGAAEGTNTEVVAGADTAYYFDDADKLVAVEGLTGATREIEVSEGFANQDGMTLVLNSSCQEGMQTFTGPTEMVGKALTVVYALSGPTVLTILGVEDLSNVPSRMIEPMKPLDDGGACCCALRRCGSYYCCPCGATCK